MKGVPLARACLAASLLAGCTPANQDVITGGPAADGGGADASGSVACAGTELPAGDSTHVVAVGGVQRTYVLHIPSAHEARRPTPLIVDFHGLQNTGAYELTHSPYPSITDQEGVVMAFPDGLKGPAGTGWNVGPCCVTDVDDLGFARALVADVGRLVCVDPNRVYAAGVLTGGGMTYAVACQEADLFAAAAPVAFDLLAENVDSCRPSRPITVVSYRGTSDPKVPYEGGASSLVPGMPITFLGAETTFARWAAIDGCSDAASARDPDGCEHHAACRSGVEVVLCTVAGAGQSPDATVTWPILRRHSR